MFGWSRNKSPPPLTDAEARAAVDASIENAMKLGGILEDNPGLVVMDTAMLPVTKIQMKVALRIAWKVAGSQGLKEAIEVCYLGLAQFQDGVGTEPINLETPKTDEPAEIATSLGRLLPWMNKTTEEMQSLRIEFEAFKRTSN